MDWVDSRSSWSMIISAMSERGLGCERSTRSIVGREGVFVRAIAGWLWGEKGSWGWTR